MVFAFSRDYDFHKYGTRASNNGRGCLKHVSIDYASLDFTFISLALPDTVPLSFTLPDSS
jgi:hypothetical protein